MSSKNYYSLMYVMYPRDYCDDFLQINNKTIFWILNEFFYFGSRLSYTARAAADIFSFSYKELYKITSHERVCAQKSQNVLHREIDFF